jgi:zeta-carotene desaturase
MSDPAAQHVIVVGAGLAGLACALRMGELSRHRKVRLRVTLLEARRRLGGRATSFLDQQSGEEIDNCQHVTMGCCSAYLDLLRELDSLRHIEWFDEQYWMLSQGEGLSRRVRRSVIRPGKILGVGPGLVSHATSFVRASFLSLPSKLAIGQAALAISTCDRTEHRDRTFIDWLASQSQPHEAIERFWRPIVVSACNLDPERVCAATALHVFQDGVFGGANAARIGIPNAPLARLYEHAESLLASRGGQLLLGEAAEEITPTRVVTRIAGGTRVHNADAVVCALPFEKARRVVAQRTNDPRFAAMDTFNHSPILGVHLRFDRPVLDVPHAVLVERDTQWLFRKDREGRQIHAVISAADAWMDLSEGQIATKVCEDLHACFPASTTARLEHIRAVKERFATFAATPAFERSRPGPLAEDATSPQVILAGDYTATDWPATMEGATRSGRIAADTAFNMLQRS